jgi:hypothetical protein
MERHSVTSSNIRSVGYDPSSKVLEVEFSNGGVYQYADVPGQVYADLEAAESVGRYFSANIRNAFKATRIEHQPKEDNQ